MYKAMSCHSTEVAGSIPIDSKLLVEFIYPSLQSYTKMPDVPTLHNYEKSMNIFSYPVLDSFN